MSAVRVLIADRMSPRAAEILRGHAGIEVVAEAVSADALLAGIGDYDGLIVRSRTRVTAEVIARADRLKVIGRAGIGVDNIDVAAATGRGIVVMNAPFGNNITTAEHAVTLLMALSRHVPQATAAMREGRWDKNRFMGHQIFGKTIGVIGLGNIGRLVAGRLLGLGAKIVAYDPFISAERCTELGARKVELTELFARADVITCHVPLNEHTRNLLDDAAFAAMKRGVHIVNCARGGIVNEGDLLAALESGQVGGAALDVFEREPPPVDHPLRGHDRVILTPHLGASTVEAQDTVAEQIADQIGAMLTSGTITNALNAPAISGAELEALRPYVQLGGTLGSLAGTIHSADVERIEVRYTGLLSERDCSPITARLVASLLRRLVDDAVNDVNAQVMARERGIVIESIAAGEHPDYTNAIELRLVGGAGTRVAGAVYGRSSQRVLQIDGYSLEMVPGGPILLVKNADRPGIIGAIGGELGRRGINVSRLAVGTGAESGLALQVWSVDRALDDEALAQLRALPGVIRVTRLHL